MPSKDHDAFDVNFLLDSIDTFTESVEAHFDNVARSLQDAFRQNPWIPDSVKPRPPPPSPPRLTTFKSPMDYIRVTKSWVSENRAVTAAIIAFVGTGAFIFWRGRRSKTKRRARRTKAGARIEVVILYGSPYFPLTRSLALDLERKGFIVYIPVSTLPEEQLIQNISRPDIRPLSLDITSPSSTDATMQKLHSFLSTPRKSAQGIPAHTHCLTAFIFVPPSNSISPAAITTLQPADWSNVLTSNILAPITTISAFLPLMTSHSSTLVFLTPAIMSSHIFPADYVADSAVQGAMTAYINTLKREISPSSLLIAEISMGHFDFSNGVPSTSPSSSPASPSPKSHSTGVRVPTSKHHSSPASPRGTPLRVLHNAIFDAIERRTHLPPSSSSFFATTHSSTPFKSRSHIATTFVGRGSRLYDLIGRWFPPNLVGWMMSITGHKTGGPPLAGYQRRGVKQSSWASSTPPLTQSLEWIESPENSNSNKGIADGSKEDGDGIKAAPENSSEQSGIVLGSDEASGSASPDTHSPTSDRPQVTELAEGSMEWEKIAQ